MEGFSVNSILITGAGRGIGLEFAKQLVHLPHPPQHLFVTCRNLEAATDLQELATRYPCIHLFQLDVLDFDSYPKLVDWIASELKGQGLNVLINNAAVKGLSDSLLETTSDNMILELRTNTVAPLMLCKALLPLLKLAASSSNIVGMNISKAAIVNMSTMMASISQNTGGGVYPYRASKVGLNMITKSLSVDLKDYGILCIAMHPGWVLTEMGGPDALIDATTSVNGLLQVLSTLQESDTGTFIKYNGEKLPW